MTQKYDAGKGRLDLFPYDAVQVGKHYYPLDEMAPSIARWWYIRPRPLEVSIPERMLLDIGRVLAFGASKYVERGWEGGIAYSRLFAAAMRHSLAAGRGEVNDPESGLPHEAHFYCNLAFIVALGRRHGDKFDDRPAPDAKLVEQYDRVEAFVSQFTGAAQPRPEPPQGEQN